MHKPHFLWADCQPLTFHHNLKDLENTCLTCSVEVRSRSRFIANSSLHCRHTAGCWKWEGHRARPLPLGCLEELGWRLPTGSLHSGPEPAGQAHTANKMTSLKSVGSRAHLASMRALSSSEPSCIMKQLQQHACQAW